MSYAFLDGGYTWKDYLVSECSNILKGQSNQWVPTILHCWSQYTYLYATEILEQMYVSLTGNFWNRII